MLVGLGGDFVERLERPCPGTPFIEVTVISAVSALRGLKLGRLPPGLGNVALTKMAGGGFLDENGPPTVWHATCAPDSVQVQRLPLAAVDEVVEPPPAELTTEPAGSEMFALIVSASAGPGATPTGKSQVSNVELVDAAVAYSLIVPTVSTGAPTLESVATVASLISWISTNDPVEDVHPKASWNGMPVVGLIQEDG
jgi:hypothetical protein